ncbi:DUF2608 domain-containing protein [Asticcacaulis sp. YBE204]|uniref:DUF2608 domain-containing protein n=1 Tax=Asticcacaulis sp. YBE204 TaxID=1282363 RepID=UPI0003C3F165|nr:DUF2608 domain-containing protein [Asticcacaulis sp. YBE204]ESQ79064.1 hypothetical protein AEYBE204_11610 [Asticcacaulis sp. YBE204]
MRVHRTKGLVGSLIFGLALLAAPVMAQTAHPELSPEGFYSVTDLNVPVEKALSEHANRKRVLVVVDIDDTIMTMPQDLGSEGWLAERMNEVRAKTPEGQTPNFEPIFFEQAVWYQVTNMMPTQPDGPALIAKLQGEGVPVFALTARNPALRGATERVLELNKIDLSKAPECIKPLCTKSGRLRDSEIRAAGQKLNVTLLNTPYKDITVSDGIMMTTGQDKGIMLRLLAGSLGQTFDLIIFVDDSKRNVENVVRASKDMKIPVYTYRYERIWPKVAAIHATPERMRAADAIAETTLKIMCLAVVSDLCSAPPIAQTPLEPVQ